MLSDAYLPTDPDLALRHLGAGRQIAAEKFRDRALTAGDVVWALVEEAVETMDRLPDRERAWMAIGSVSAGFGGSGLTKRELLALEQLRYLCAMKPYDGPTGRVIDRAQGARAFDVMLWLRWIGVHVATKDPVKMRKAAVALARGGDSTAFHRIWRPGSKIHRQAVKNFRQQLCGHVIEGLKKDLSIHHVNDGYFSSIHGSQDA